MRSLVLIPFPTLSGAVLAAKPKLAAPVYAITHFHPVADVELGIIWSRYTSTVFMQFNFKSAGIRRSGARWAKVQLYRCSLRCNPCSGTSCDPFYYSMFLNWLWRWHRHLSLESRVLKACFEQDILVNLRFLHFSTPESGLNLIIQMLHNGEYLKWCY